MRRRHGERGQILIITGVSMVVLIAIGAIVADLGFSWLLHRQEQNAADPASLAAARYINGTGVTDRVLMEQEACFYVQQNGFFVGDAGCAAAYLNGDLHVKSPPTSTYAGNFRGRLGYVEVLITATHPSFFGQFFGQPVATVRTAAVVAHTEGNANSSSLVALGGTCQGSTDNGASNISGGGTLYIHPANAGITEGGYMNVNAPCGQIGNPNLCDGTGGAGAALALSGRLRTTSRVFLVGGCKTSGVGSGLTCLGVNPCLDEQQVPMGNPLADVPEPFPLLEASLPVPLCPNATEINAPNDPNPCSLSATGGPNAPCPTGTCTMLPGIYYSGWDVKSNVAIVMKPGMYVFAGGGLKVTGGASIMSVTDVDGSGNPIDARVTIFSTDGPMCPTSQNTTCEGAITLTSSGPLRLKATNDMSCQQVSPQICPWSGILLWQDGSVQQTPGDVSISGQGDLILSGTIYAPKSKVTISGGTNGSGCTTAPGQTQICLAVQLIAMSWTITGGGTIDMPYDPNELFHVTQIGLVH